MDSLLKIYSDPEFERLETEIIELQRRQDRLLEELAEKFPPTSEYRKWTIMKDYRVRQISWYPSHQEGD